MQIHLLRLLALMGAGEQTGSLHMYTMLGETMKQSAVRGSASTIANALLY